MVMVRSWCDRYREALVETAVTRLIHGGPTVGLTSEGDFHRLRSSLAMHLDFAAGALSCSRLDAFRDYCAWNRTYRIYHDAHLSRLTLELSALADAVALRAADEVGAKLLAMLREVLGSGGEQQYPDPGPLKDNGLLGSLPRDYLNELLAGHRQAAYTLVQQAVRSGVSVSLLYSELFLPVQSELGRLWLRGEITTGHEHYCTGASMFLVSQLFSELVEEYQLSPSAVHDAPRVLLTCVRGNTHAFGANLVANVFTAAGWDTYFLGADTPNNDIVATAKQWQPRVVLLSVSMTTQSPVAKEAVAELREELPGVAVVVGGRILREDPELASVLGADGTAADAFGALDVAREVSDKVT